MKKSFFRKTLSVTLALLLCVATNAPFFQIAEAASLTGVSNVVTRHKISVTTSNDITFDTVSASSLAASGTITLDYSPGAIDPTMTTLTSIIDPDVSLTVGGVAQTFGTFASGVASNSATDWGFSATSAPTIITLTAPSGMSTIGSGVEINFKIGTAAGGTDRITNSGSTGTEVLTVTLSTSSDSASIAMPIISDDQVTITARVYPTIVFNITEGTIALDGSGSATNAVDFGTLNHTAVKYATPNASSGGTTSLTTPALDLTIGTNAPSGYSLTFVAPTSLGISPSGPYIPGPLSTDVTSIVNDGDGTPTTAQFAMNATQPTGATTTSTYKYDSGTPANSEWSFATATTTTLVTHGSATTDTIGVRYLANIPITQTPGVYSVAMTYIVTGNF